MSGYNHKTENFFTRHAKLIAFLATVTAFLLIFGPVLFFETADFFKIKGDERPQMTLEQLITLAEQGGIRAEQLTKFACTEQEDEDDPNRTTIKLRVENGKYLVIAIVDERHGGVNECYIWDMQNEDGKSYDVLHQNLRDIFKE